jgi:oxygen-independent coproporphyrinogen-3 oxidase
MVNSIVLEIEKRRDYLPKNTIINTIYFGGGTPSLLLTKQLEQILTAISKNFILELEELTVETNPDDLKKEKLRELRSIGIDRLSIGIQSFDAHILKYYNRAHNAEESLQAIDLAKNAGFEKLSIDLIYGFPSASHQLWKKDLAIAIEQDPGHISSYCLTIEPKTALGNWAEKGKFIPASEDFAADQFEILQAKMEKANYIQYEISNFGKPGQFAIHNKNYWLNIPYLGIGPSAHSYDGKERGFNIANNSNYISALKSETLPFAVEPMTTEDLVNEYILTSLRTIWGTNINFLKARLGNSYLTDKANLLSQLQSEQLMEIKSNHFLLTKKGKLLADSIAASLFI